MTRFISLGGDCQTAQQIRHNGCTEKHFFDWLVVPVHTVRHLIERDFGRHFNVAALVPHQHPTGLEKVADTENNIDFFHEFAKFDPETIRVVQEKYRYLAEKFMRLMTDPSHDRPYFVRRWHEADGLEDEAAARRLHDVLIAKVRGSRLLYLHNDRDREPVIEASYRSCYLPQSGRTWEGNHEAWRQILSAFAVEETG